MLIKKTFLFSTISVLFLTLLACNSSSNKSDQQTKKQASEPKSSNTAQTVANTNNSQDNKELPEYLKNLQWVVKADVEKDLKAAVEKSDYSFLTLASRVPVVPGIEPNDAADLISRCGQKYIPGLGDVIFDDAHEKLHSKAMSYAKQYNKELLKYCKEASM